MTLPYKPIKAFTGSTENVEAVGTASIDYLNADNDETRKMFDPDSTHNNGDPGGISKGNLVKDDEITGENRSGIITEDNISGYECGNATNVTTNINGHAIVDIFETNGTTVKEATQLSGATGGKWVEIINTTVDVPTGTINSSLKLRPGGQHNIYSFSVYVVSPIAGIYQAYGVPNQANAYITRIHENQSGDNRDYLSIKNDLPFVDITVAAKVWVWESS